MPASLPRASRDWPIDNVAPDPSIPRPPLAPTPEQLAADERRRQAGCPTGWPPENAAPILPSENAP